MKNSEASSFEALLGRALGVVCSVLDAYTAVLFLRDKPGDGYRLAAHFSLGDAVDAAATLQEGQGLVGWTLRNREPLVIGNFDQKRGKLGYYRDGEEAGVKAFMGCPLDDGLGALAIDTKRTYSFATKDQKLLHQFAQFISALCKNEDSHAERPPCRGYNDSLQLILDLRRRFPRWSAYLENFLTLLADSSGFQVCFLAVRDEGGKSYSLEGWNQPFLDDSEAAKRHFPFGGGLVGWVFKNGAPIFCGQDEPSLTGTSLFGRQAGAPRFKSVVCLPLPMHRRTRGVLALAHEEPKTLSEDLKQFLRMVSEHLALFLENLYLKNRLAAASPREER